MLSDLNQRAARLAESVMADRDRLRVATSTVCGATVVDCGVHAPGGLAAGLLLARVCMADLADIQIVPGDRLINVPQVAVHTDHPVEACLLSQYAGWKIATDSYFAMGSGPMRIRARVEPLQRELAGDETGSACVGVLESSALPTDEAIELIRTAVGGVNPLLLVARTASLAGSIQVVARSLETALHKLHELQFPVEAIACGTGVSPLPPVARNDLEGIGRTNDAVLYGSTVNLWVRCEDDLIQSVGALGTSSSSPDHGRQFLELFAEANHDFYRIDPGLFAPAVVVFHNVRTGNTFEYGVRNPELLAESFGMRETGEN